MQKENWTAIASAEAVQLEDADRILLDRIQERLALNDEEFLQFLIVIGKVSAGSKGLKQMRLKVQSLEQ